MLKRNSFFVLFVAAILGYGAAFAWYLLDRFDLVNLIRDVNQNDAFYYFQIAYRMAGGEFSTYDGLTRTNGYHPLWLFLITPFYWVFDKTEALFAIKAFEIMLVAGGAALVAGAARVARLPWILLFAAAPALCGNWALYYGMEAAAALFLLALFLLAICLFARDPARWRWPLAAVAFALPWVRLEYAAISVAATAALCLVEWSGPVPESVPLPAEGASRARRGGWRGWRRSVFALNSAAPLAGAAAGILVYFTYNALVFGGAVPVSGATKAFWSEQRWERQGGYDLTENALAYLQSGAFDHELPVALEICVYAAVVWWFSRRSRGQEDRLLLAFLIGLFGLTAGRLSKLVQGVLTVDAWFGVEMWYFVPKYLMEPLAVPTRCWVAMWFVRRVLSSRGPGSRASGIPTLGIAAVGAVFLFLATDFSAPFRWVDSKRESVSLHWKLVEYAGAMVMNRVLPEDSVVAMHASDKTGYFSRSPVMNTDSMVNSRDYLHALREKTAAAFLQRHGITHHATISQVDDSPPLVLFEGHRWSSTSNTNFKFWPAEWREASWSKVDRFDWFRGRMEPHLERQSDGVGLLVDGRIAQAFAWDCGPGRVSAWTWEGKQEGNGRMFLPWTQTSIGFCTSAVLLPHDARPPVRAATMTADEYLRDRFGELRPAIGADFDVRLVENRLIYVKESCGQEDVAARFFLHVDPVDPDDLPGPRRRHGFDNLDFGFAARGLLLEPCVAEVPLPDYGIAAIRTGQFVEVEDDFNVLWEREIRVGPGGVPLGGQLADRVAGRRPEIESGFDAHLVDDALVYVKEQCGPEDVDARFFLHVFPADPDDLPGPRRRHGFDNFDFRFDERGVRFDGTCLATVHLPDYGISTIRTGQSVAVENGWRRLWEGEISIGPD